MRRLRSRRTTALGLISLVVLAGGSGAHAQETPLPAIDEAGWQGVLGVRAAVSTAQRYVVLLEEPSLASRVRVAGGQATEAQMRSWTTAAEREQEQFFSRIAAAGARVAPEYRYVRVLNGFSARLDPTALALLESDREVASVYPVRAAFPAQAVEAPDVTPSAVRGLEIPGVGRDRSHGRAARHRDRSLAPVPAPEPAPGNRPDQPWAAGPSRSPTRRFPGVRSATEPSWPGSSRAPTVPADCTESLPVRRSSRFASPAGSRTPRAATPSTPAPTR